MEMPQMSENEMQEPEQQNAPAQAAPKGRRVLPGDEIGIAEEYAAGENAYERDGKIFSAAMGEVMEDGKAKALHVAPRNPVNKLQYGDVVIGMVKDIRSSKVIVDVLESADRQRAISGDTNGTLQISKVQEAYTKDLKHEFCVGDIILAKVISNSPSLQLTTAAPDLGVVRATCHGCRATLVRKGQRLSCDYCGKTETRKFASTYGAGSEQ